MPCICFIACLKSGSAILERPLVSSFVRNVAYVWSPLVFCMAVMGKVSKPGSAGRARTTSVRVGCWAKKFCMSMIEEVKDTGESEGAQSF